MKKTLWTRNFTLVTVGSALGAIGGIASSFALSFLVFDETGSTFAAALLLAIEVIPGFIIPMVAAPWMDRLPRKPFLVWGDAINGLLYAIAGLYLMFFEFSYGGYLVFSLVLASLGAFDSLAYESIYPMLIPDGLEEKGYTIASMLYPIMKVVMMPVAAVLFETLGVATLLIIQGGLSVLAAVCDSCIKLKEENRMQGERFSFKLWWGDICEAVAYLKKERGLMSIFSYMSVTNGVSIGYSPLLVAFFRSFPGYTVAMYSFFSVAEFAGRTLGGVFRYNVKLPPKKRFGFAFMVYQIYDSMDACLLWLPYPLMLANRAVCGFLGINSATLRQAAVQRYLPEQMRARVNAFSEMLMLAVGALCSLVVGALGEVLDYRLCMTLCGLTALCACWLTVWLRRAQVRPVYEAQ